MDFERDVRKLQRMLRQDGFWLVKGGGSQSHEKWTDGNRSVTLPRTKEIRKEKTAKSIYIQAGWL